ncbi:MAG: FAD-dependent oxidoreductase, partial [bacterium]
MSENRTRIVIVGGVACGPKAAARARRCDSKAEIILIERGRYLSYAGCGLPYFIGGAVPEMDGLMTTPYGIVRDEEFFLSFKDIAVRTGTLAESIDRTKQTLRVRDLESGRREEIPYDRLVLATGARPASLPVPGADLGRVFSLHVPGDALQIRKLIEDGEVDHAVLIGGGRVSLEAAEALFAHAVDSTVVEIENRLLPGALDPEMSALVENELRENDVEILTSEKVIRLEGNDDGIVCRVVTDRRTVET